MSESKSEKRRVVPAVLVLLFFVAVVVVNALANILPLNGVNTGVLSDEIPNLFVPAGLTFSVWAFIYVLLALYSSTVLFRATKHKGTDALWEPKDGWIFIVNAAANIGWIFSWHWRLIPLSLALMLVILVTLIMLEERNYRRSLKEDKNPSLLEGFHRFALRSPINVYLGWISVATIANATALFVKLGWNGFGLSETFWAVAVILAGLLVALGLVFRRKAIAAPLVVIWAYAGIAIKRIPLDGASTQPVWIAALVAAGLIAASILLKRLVPSLRKTGAR